MDGHPLLGMGGAGREPFTLVKQHTSRIRALALLWKLHSPPQEGGEGRRQKLKQLGNVFALAPSLHPVPSKVPTGRELHGPSIALSVLAHLRSEEHARRTLPSTGSIFPRRRKMQLQCHFKVQACQFGPKSCQKSWEVSISRIKVPDQVLFTNTGKQSRTPVLTPLPSPPPPFCLSLALPWERGTGCGGGGEWRGLV